jgi:hypothetical protein
MKGGNRLGFTVKVNEEAFVVFSGAFALIENGSDECFVP